MGSNYSLKRLIAANDWDWDAVGSWPLGTKILLWAATFTTVLLVGYALYLAPLQATLNNLKQKEQQLKQQFEHKVQQAANLAAYRDLATELEATWLTLTKQLSSNTEITQLLEAITTTGTDHGLVIKSITVGDEAPKAFYSEHPIHIILSGHYHGMGGFVSDIASLPDLITLHDITIRTDHDTPLTMHVTAKTYHYPPADDT